MKSFFHDNANDDKNKNEKFQQISTGQSFKIYVQESRVSTQLFPNRCKVKLPQVVAKIKLCWIKIEERRKNL